MHYSVESKKKWLKSMGVWRKVRVKKKKEKLPLKLNRSLGELHSETCTWYLPMRGPATHIISILISLTHIKYCLEP